MIFDMHDFDIFGYQPDDTLYTVLTRGYIGRFLMLTVISEVEREQRRGDALLLILGK